MLWLPRLRWRDLDPEEAVALDLDQAARVQWQVFEFAWLCFGIIMAARPRP